ncbi:MAG: class I SAM-dependent methyltransferase [Actinomycetota bacterium]|nr:class I SAM-dependent methyltransferase [Actinomycetota bacterium]
MPPSAVNHPIFAQIYVWLSHWMEPELAAHRRSLLAGLSGQVLEVGAGNGLNFSHYPVAVTRVLAVEPEPHLRALAISSAAKASVPVEVVDGIADQLPADESSVDAAVTSLVLCSVPDQASALAEISRVLRPGGQLRFLEHVRARSATLGCAQRLLDATIWPRIAGGCHTHRDTAAAIRQAGFTIEQLQPLRFPDFRLLTPTSPHILGIASLPAHPGDATH